MPATLAFRSARIRLENPDGNQCLTRVFFIDDHGHESEITQCVRFVSFSHIWGEFPLVTLECYADIKNIIAPELLVKILEK